MAPPSHPLFGQRVILFPVRGWETDALGPERARAPDGTWAAHSVISVMGGTRHFPQGTLAEYGVFDAAQAVAAPAHLSDAEAAALPICGLTAWRAVASKARVQAGENVLVTGIGGGVALFALQAAVARGANVWVSSASPAKIARAVALGARGGVLYSAEKWEKLLAAQLPRDRPWIDAVVDGAGGDVVQRVTPIMADGGRIVSYGMTLGPVLPVGMGAVLKNLELLGSTMGSRREFGDMVAFVGEKRLRPVISRVVEGLGLEGLEELWADMKAGRQFGKLVISIWDGKDVELAKQLDESCKL